MTDNIHVVIIESINVNAIITDIAVFFMFIMQRV